MQKISKVKLIIKKILVIPFFICLNAYASNPLYSSQQLIIVTSKDWDTSVGTLQRYERTSENMDWQEVGDPIPVNLGANGMGWGIGLHGGSPLTKGPVVDREGLMRSPVGAFTIPLAFGKDDATVWPVKLPYQKISPTIFCSGDPKSKNYNRIVDTNHAPQEDWSLAEDMQDYVNQGVYTYGAVIGHNYSPAITGKGSCFFLHVWRGPGIPTGGCTAMSEDNAREIISWLDPQKNPILVQLPEVIYPEFQKEWGLPDLIKSNSHIEL